jgi:hypothetical protein
MSVVRMRRGKAWAGFGILGLDWTGLYCIVCIERGKKERKKLWRVDREYEY